jgi:hypothetical protein
MEKFKKWYKLLVMQGAIDKIHISIIKPQGVFFLETTTIIKSMHSGINC